MSKPRVGSMILVGILIFLAACSPGAEPQPAPVNTPIPTSPPPPPDTDVPEPTQPPTATAVPEPTQPPTEAPQAAFNSERAQQILEQGVIRIGTRASSLPPFVQVEGGYTGFEVEIAEAIIDRLFEGAVEIEWVGVSSGERFSALGEGQIDLLVRTVVHTRSREEMALWSDPYFIGGPRTLVREGEGIASLTDLDGKRVSVIEGTVDQLTVQTLAASAGIEITEVPSDSVAGAVAAFAEGEADAFVGDWLLLLTLTADEPSYQIVGDILSRQPFAIGIPPGEEALREDVNRALRAIVDGGTYDTIYDQWFSEPHPWTLEEMLNEPPLEV